MANKVQHDYHDRRRKKLLIRRTVIIVVCVVIVVAIVGIVLFINKLVQSNGDNGAANANSGSASGSQIEGASSSSDNAVQTVAAGEKDGKIAAGDNLTGYETLYPDLYAPMPLNGGKLKAPESKTVYLTFDDGPSVLTQPLR